jgi:hypothetical protein
MKFDKLTTFAAILEEGGVAKVFVVPSRSLRLPPDLLYPALLEYGLAMPNPIPDLRWTKEGIHATLSFGTIPHETFVPWDSVVGLGPRGGDFMITWMIPDETARPTTPKQAAAPKLSVVR